MVSITQSQRWRQQPAGATQIDRSHPMARGLVFAIVGNMPYAEEMVSGNLSQPLGTSTAKTFNTGVGLYSPSNVGNGWFANYDPNVFRTIGNEFTIACEFVAESIGDVSILVGAPWADGTYNAPKVSFCLRRVTTTSTMMIEIGTTSATNINATFSNAMISDGEKATYVAVRNGATASLLRDNVPMTLAGSGLTSGANVGYDTASHVCLMNRNATSVGNGTGGGILWTYIWNRALTDQEQQSIYYNPYEIILPVDRTRFYMAAAIDDITGSSVIVPKVATVTSSGTFASIAVKEFSFEFSSEFSKTADNSGAAVAIAKKDVVLATGARTIPARTGSSAAALISLRSSASGAFSAAPVTKEFSSEFSVEFVSQPPNISGTSVLAGKISAVLSSGARTLVASTGTSVLTGTRPSISAGGSRTIPVRTGTSVATSPRPAESATGSRTIPARTGTASVTLAKTRTDASGSSAVVPVSGSSVLSALQDRVSVVGARTIPVRGGAAALIISKDLISATGTRTIPAISGSALLTSPKPAVNASQVFLAVGGSALIAPSSRVSITGTRTSPARTGASALSAPKQILVGVGSRIINAVSGNSSLRAPKAVAISFAPSVDATQYGILLSSKCADVMLSAIGTTLNSGIVRIYSGSEPVTATAVLNGNTQLAELAFGSTAFGAPMFVNASRVITANLMISDSSADADGVATFFRAFRSDGSTIIWQGSAGEGNELILAGSGTNPYQIRQGSPVAVVSLTVSIRLF